MVKVLAVSVSFSRWLRVLLELKAARLPCFVFFWIQKEKFHTHLAVLYLEKVLSSLSASPPNEEQLSSAREKLQGMLRESNLYRVQYLLGRCGELW